MAVGQKKNQAEWDKYQRDVMLYGSGFLKINRDGSYEYIPLAKAIEIKEVKSDGR